MTKYCCCSASLTNEDEADVSQQGVGGGKGYDVERVIDGLHHDDRGVLHAHDALRYLEFKVEWNYGRHSNASQPGQVKRNRPRPKKKRLGKEANRFVRRGLAQKNLIIVDINVIQ